LKYIFTQTKLNLRLHRWLELIKNYDVRINYHLGKANVIANALSRKKHCSVAIARRMRPELHQEIKYLNLAMMNETATAVEVEPMLKVKIRKA
jgi:hypothetical protein